MLPTFTNISCPHCNGLIASDPNLAGQQVACPHCKRHLVMPAAPVLARTQPVAQQSGSDDSPTESGGMPFWKLMNCFCTIAFLVALLLSLFHWLAFGYWLSLWSLFSTAILLGTPAALLFKYGYVHGVIGSKSRQKLGSEPIRSDEVQGEPSAGIAFDSGPVFLKIITIGAGIGVGFGALYGLVFGGFFSHSFFGG